MINLDHIIDAIYDSDGGDVHIVLSPCRDCGYYHVVDGELEVSLCDICRGPSSDYLSEQIRTSVRVKQDGSLR